MKKRLLITLLCIVGLFSVFGSTSFSAIMNVSKGGPPPTYATIQEALNAASANEYIMLTSGSYSGSGNVNLVWPNTQNVTLFASPNGTATLDANNSARHFIQHNAVTWYLGGLVLVNGSATSTSNPVNNAGGGVYSDVGGSIYVDATGNNHNLYFDKGTISGNAALTEGGAVYSVAAEPNLYFRDSLIQGNHTNGWGGFGSRGTIYLWNDTIRANGADLGSGVREGGVISHGGVFVSGSVFQSNIASNAGGVFSMSSVTVNNSTFNQNTAGTGQGGVFFVCDTWLTDVAFLGNTAGNNGGVFHYGTNIMRRIYFEKNSAGNVGGVFNEGTNWLQSSILYGNSAITGGGVFYRGSNNLINCLVVSNDANHGLGHGAAFYEGDNLIMNSTFAKNCSNNYYDGSVAGSTLGEMEMYNSIVIGNFAPTDPSLNANYATTTLNYCGVMFSSSGPPFFTQISTVPTSAITSNIVSIQPGIFANFNANDYRLTSNANVINVGSTAIWNFAASMNFGYPAVTSDLAGMNRVTGSAIDMGAYEFGSTAGGGGASTGNGTVTPNGYQHDLIIVDAGGNPISNAAVYYEKFALNSTSMNRLSIQVVMPSVTGHVQFTDTDNASVYYSVSIGGPGYVYQYKLDVSTTNRYISERVTLNAAPLTITGQITNRYGAALANATVFVISADRAAAMMAWYNTTVNRVDFPYVAAAMTTTDANGIYSLQVDARNWTQYVQAPMIGQSNQGAPIAISSSLQVAANLAGQNFSIPLMVMGRIVRTGTSIGVNGAWVSFLKSNGAPTLNDEAEIVDIPSAAQADTNGNFKLWVTNYATDNIMLIAHQGAKSDPWITQVYGAHTSTTDNMYTIVDLVLSKNSEVAINQYIPLYQKTVTLSYTIVSVNQVLTGSWHTMVNKDISTGLTNNVISKVQIIAFNHGAENGTIACAPDIYNVQLYSPFVLAPGTTSLNGVLNYSFNNITINSSQHITLDVTATSFVPTVNPPAYIILSISTMNRRIAGNNNSLVVDGSGVLWATGANSFGQLGISTNSNLTTWNQVLTGVKQVAGVGYFSLAIKNDGTLWATGQNDYGQLGNGTTTNRTTWAPTSITGCAQIAAGYDYSLALKSDGSVWGTGYNVNGELGNGASSPRTTWNQVLTSCVQIAAGYSHSLALKNDGTLWATGVNISGQLGSGNTASRVTWGLVLTGCVQIAAGADHSLAIMSDGTLWATGHNGFGELGIGSVTNQSTWQSVLAGCTQVGAGANHSLAIRNDGSVWGTGYNVNGALGIGTTSNRTSWGSVPITGCIQVGAGAYHSLAIKTNGTLWATGLNDVGQLGDGTTKSTSNWLRTYNNPPASTVYHATLDIKFVDNNGQYVTNNYVDIYERPITQNQNMGNTILGLGGASSAGLLITTNKGAQPINGPYYVQIEAKRAGFVSMVSFVVVTQDRSISLTLNLLSATCTLSGKVTDPWDGPIVSADVFALPSASISALFGFLNAVSVTSNDLLMISAQRTKTNTAGGYSLAVSSGDWGVFTQVSNNYPATINLLSGVVGSLGGLNYIFDPNPSINIFKGKFYVKDGNNNPLPNALVQVDVFSLSGSSNSLYQIRGSSDSTGLISGDIVSTTNLYAQVFVSKIGYTTRMQIFVITQDRLASMNVVLYSAPYTISGKIVDELLVGTRNVQVFAVPTSAYSSLLDIMSSINKTDIGTDLALTTTNVSGNYTLYLCTGNWTVLANKSSNNTVPPGVISYNVSVPPSVSGLDYQLANFATVNISGVAIDQSGNPVAHALVYVIQASGTPINAITDLVSSVYATTDATGLYSLTFLCITSNHIQLGAYRGTAMNSFDSGMPNNPQYMNTIVELNPAAVQNISLTLNLIAQTATVSGQIISKDVVVTRSLWVMMSQSPFGPTDSVVVNQFWVNVVRATGSYQLSVATGNYQAQVYGQFIPGPQGSQPLFSQATSFNADSTYDIYITSKNNVPSFSAFVVTPLVLTENDVITFSITCSDPDNDALTLTLTGINGHLDRIQSVISGVNTISYHTSYVDSGVYTLQAVLSDGRAMFGSVTRSVSITINNVTNMTIAIATPTIRLISLPVGQVVSANKWTYFGWNQANNFGMGGYTTADVNTIGLGQAVWVKATNDIVIDLTTGNQTVADRQVNLVRGWNLVANPHMTQYDVSKSMVVSYNGQTYSLMAAVSANLIHNAAYGWDGTQFVSADVLLNPFEGVFIGAIRPVMLLLPTRDGVVTVMHMASMQAAGRELVLQVQALQDGNPLGQVKLVANDARAVFTDAMVPPPSPMGGDIGLYAVKEGVQLLTMQQPIQDAMQWPITVVAATAGNVTLRVSDVLNTQATPYQLSVFDAQNNVVVPVQNGQVTIYQNAGMSQYVIKAINIFTASDFDSLRVYPNPFSPANDINVNINYNSSTFFGSSFVIVTSKLKIYTIHGRKVLEQTSSTLGKSAKDNLTWNGRDDNGVLMPSGLYFYMLDLTDSLGKTLKSKGKIVLWQ